MAIDAYMYFQDYDGKYQESESQVDVSIINDKDQLWKDAKLGFKDAAGASPKGLFEVEDFSFDIEQTLNIGSQSSGAGAGKVTFNPFSITRKIDQLSPILFERACSGTPFQRVGLGARKSAGGTTSGIIYLTFIFKLVAVKTMSYSYDDESPKETVTFEYGAVQITYAKQKPNGEIAQRYPAGWNRVRNVQDRNPDPDLK